MVRFIQRVSLTMPPPTLIDGRPQRPWTPSVVREDWRKLQLIIGGYGMTKPRGKRFIPLTDAETEPFGDAEATFAFPGLTEFDDPEDWHLLPLTPVRLRGKDTDGNFHVMYEGELASIEPATEFGLVIHCLGAINRMDLLKLPPDLVRERQDYGRLIPRAFNRKRRDLALHIGEMRHVHTGIAGAGNADFAPFLGTVQDWLSNMTDDAGNQWTVTLQRPRTPKLELKDTTTVHATISYGAPGVVMATPLDYTTATTAVYGSGTNGHCTWMGARFPNNVQTAVPDFPLAPGDVFNPGDSTGGFAPFAAFLRRGQYGTIVSDDTYAAADVDNVEQFQDRAGITIDGIVGAQTWEAAFEPGFNQGSVRGAYVDTIWEKKATRRRLYNAQGADIGRNPDFNPAIPRIEDYIPFGDNVSKNLGRAAAKQIVSRAYPAGRLGTITLTTDPTEKSRYLVGAGDNVLVENFAGTSVLVHVARRDRNWRDGTVTLTVDEKSRDLLTAAAIHQRNKDVSDLTRRQRFGRRNDKIFDAYGTILCEDGAGELPLMNQQGGFWNVQRVAGGPKGSIERIALALGTGLTEHLLNQAIAQKITSIPGATRGSMLIFAGPVTANQIANLPGMATPLTALADGTNPVDNNQNALDDHGLIYAVGGPNDGVGYYPNNDPGDGSIDPTGLFEDGGGVAFGPTGHYWLWVAIWTEGSCKVGGRLFPGAP
jgi:hypothetical protein